ncbi:MBL fold metallo-hydrolase [Actinorhabdospora filicis]|uniref:MBL fold metallo-hydrolase n=1 Tax=Actinorhabdospora filicis TaxID=1785913 RepID=A0A9W6W4X6_9ACTN|nr:MBL fold metallo-hydrolase [Actinorhabdospora filicis]GLZ79747.1 MBL fold metallo-hydrolase [Actinorhabdospora filicis]
MRLTKHNHACVRFDDGDRALVIDPGIWASPEILDGVTDVLITHEHADHLNPALLEGVRVHAHPDVAKGIDSAVPIEVGEVRTIAGFLVEAVGGTHAEIYEGLPGVANLGFLVDAPSGVVYHPGDSLFVPEVRVGTLLVPGGGPWMKLGEAIDFVRAVRPRRAHPIHDKVNSAEGNALVDRWMEMKAGVAYSRVGDGGEVSV